MTGFSPLSDLIGQSQCSSIFSGPWQRILGADRSSVISGRGWVIYSWHFGQNSYYVCLFWALLDLCYPPVFPYPAINASSIPRLGVPSQIMSTPFGWPLGVAPPGDWKLLSSHFWGGDWGPEDLLKVTQLLTILYWKPAVLNLYLVSFLAIYFEELLELLLWWCLLFF